MSDLKSKVTQAACVIFGLSLMLLIQSQLNSEVHTGTYRCVKTYTVTEGTADSIRTSKRVDLKPNSGGTIETVRCDDSVFLWQFNSGELYGQFEVGKTYLVTSRGPRSFAFSRFPNVTEVLLLE